MIRYILDTDHLSLAQRRHPQVTAKIQATPDDELAVSIITAEEQLRGRFLQIRRHAAGAACVDAYRQLQETIEQLRDTQLLDFSLAAELIDQSLRSRYPRFPTQDRRIAAIALANHCVFVTRNQKRFGQIAGLTLQDWTK